MSKQFSVTLKGDPQAAVAKFKATAEKHSINFTGDYPAGQFKVMGVEGHYEISESVLTLTIKKKPALIPWTLIESKVKDFLS